MAKAAEPQKATFRERLRQIGMVFAFTAKRDKLFIPLVVAAAVLPLVLGGVLFALGLGWLWLAIGIMMALMLILLVLNFRSNKAMMAEAEGKPGAAAQIIETMRGDWRVTPAVAFNRNQDLVHRIVGRPGVVLVAEGTASRAGGLLAQERKRVGRVVGDTPIYEVLIGDGEGQVPLRKLQSHLLKLPRNLKPAQVNAIDGRLKALGGANVPIPKGPLPRGGKVPRGRVR